MWGRSKAGKTTNFNIIFSQRAFMIVISQSNARYSSAIVGVDGKDVSTTGFFGYAGDINWQTL